ncbi:MAG: tetratricopeptide repeat protein [Pirellulaceae bacterium]
MARSISIPLIGLAVLLLLQDDSLADHPLEHDPTGINWAFSLEEARARATEEGRIVILKPVAFRSSTDSTELSPSTEALRAVSLVDSRVVNLLNRRFVVYYFSMDELSSQYDAQAAALSRKLHPDMRYLASMPTPPMLFMTAEGKMLGHASNFLLPDDLLEYLTGKLDENPAYAQLTPAEKAVEDAVQRAWVHYELRQFESAIELLENQQSSDAFYLRGLIAREQLEWPEMKAAFKMVTDSARLNDIKLDQALRYWELRNFEGIKAHLEGVRPDHPRYQEAMYYLGLAWFHTDDREKALELWEAALRHDRSSAWALRLDWTFGLASLNPDEYLSPTDKPPSLLGRRYLTPDGNPDLSHLHRTR